MKRYIISSTDIAIDNYNPDDPYQARMVEQLQSGDVDRYGNAYKMKLYKLTEAYQLLASQADQVYQALQNIFSEYELLVDDSVFGYIAYPRGWPYPFNYCKSIHFGEFKIEKYDLLVPADYIDGYNTTLPQSVIDAAVRACNRPLSIMNDYKTSWPTDWPKGSFNSRIVTKLINYSKPIIDNMNEEYGVVMHQMKLPTPTSPITFVDNSGQTVFTIKYRDFIDEIRECAVTSTTRDQFAEKYRDFLEASLDA